MASYTSYTVSLLLYNYCIYCTVPGPGAAVDYYVPGKVLPGTTYRGTKPTAPIISCEIREPGAEAGYRMRILVSSRPILEIYQRFDPTLTNKI